MRVPSLETTEPVVISAVEIVVMTSSCPLGPGPNRAHDADRRDGALVPLPLAARAATAASSQATMTNRRQVRTQRIDAPMDMAPVCLNRIQRLLHQIEGSPGGVLWHCGQPPSRLPAGWNLRPPAERRFARAGTPGLSAVRGLGGSLLSLWGQLDLDRDAR